MTKSRSSWLFMRPGLMASWLCLAKIPVCVTMTKAASCSWPKMIASSWKPACQVRPGWPLPLSASWWRQRAIASCPKPMSQRRTLEQPLAPTASTVSYLASGSKIIAWPLFWPSSLTPGSWWQSASSSCSLGWQASCPLWNSPISSPLSLMARPSGSASTASAGRPWWPF